MPMRITHRWQMRAVVAVASLLCGAALAAQLDPALQISKQTTRAASESQKTIDQLADQKAAAVAEFRSLISRVESRKAYNKQLRDLINSQNIEKFSLRTQINGVDETEQGLVALMQEMIDALDQFVKLDLPFLAEERAGRVARLRANMARADISVSEKYRKILEAYSIENDYGTSISTYQGKLDDGRVVAFLQVGRVAFLYQSLDGKLAYAWDNTARAWKSLDGEYRASIAQAIAIAANTAPKDLVKLPIFAATEATR